MTFLPSDPVRRLLPRWRPSKAKATLKEQASRIAPEAIDIRELSELEQDFLEDPAPWIAADFLSATMALGAQSVAAMRASDLIMSTDDPQLEFARMLASAYMAEFSGAEPSADVKAATSGVAVLRVRISKLRALLTLDPRNSIRWVDLGLSYVTAGEPEKARRAIMNALSLEPDNRFVVRSAVRFFVHSQRPSKALRVLETTPRLFEDPWLLSAHMSVRQFEERPIQHVRQARTLMHQQSSSPFSLSELRGAMATEEVLAGSTKAAASLMREALTDPTDNTVAQAAWGVDRGLGELTQDALEGPLTFEARTISFSLDFEWSLALEEARLWIEDEPFSARAFNSAAYIAGSRLLRFDEAAEIARAGLALNPTSYRLANNAAFALANIGRLEDASHLLARYRQYPTDEQKWVMTATRGLLHFRRGETEAGRADYDSAWRGLLKSGSNPSNAVLCLVMWTREEILAGTPLAATMLDRARTAAGPKPTGDIQMWLDRVDQAE